ncbi:hypothetical protein, partial [Burkholderia seminalis]|uniref:hypothetical protein n=1 Tax=Burkholderia seminalis TaxID=488731 RepID=UPI001ABAEE8E
MHEYLASNSESSLLKKRAYRKIWWRIIPLLFVCSGLMNPDTDLGENARHEEVSNDQATSYVFP